MRFAGLPRAIQGGTAIYWKDRLLVFSGNDGEYAAREYEVGDKHPGFPTDVWSYQPGAKTWNPAGKMPQDLVSTGIAKFRDEFVIPGGEIRPTVRSPEFSPDASGHESSAAPKSKRTRIAPPRVIGGEGSEEDKMLRTRFLTEPSPAPSSNGAADFTDSRRPVKTAASPCNFDCPTCAWREFLHDRHRP